MRAAGRARGERSSGGKPRASGRRRRASGAASGTGPPGLPQPRAGPPWTPPSWRGGPAVQAVPSVRLGSDWRMQGCRRCLLAPSELWPLGGVASPPLRRGRSPGSRFRSARGRTGDVVITVNSSQRRGASALCGELTSLAWTPSVLGSFWVTNTIRSVCSLDLPYSSSLWKNLDGAGQLSLQGGIRGP